MKRKKSSTRGSCASERSKSSRLNRTKLLVATTNPGKAREIRRDLRGLRFEILALGSVLPGASFRERGKTFLENARAKSVHYSRLSGLLTLAEDSGLEIDALGGAPGVISARFSRPKPTDARNNAKVLRLLENVPWKARRARFVCMMVLAMDGKVLREFRGEVRGFIGFEPRGRNGFGYDPLFHHPGLGKRFAELSDKGKNGISHRGRALKKLRSFLLTYQKPIPQ
jgi:XTP/dITP diphosphohydrolase